MNKKISLHLGIEYLCVYLLLLFKSGFYFSGSVSAITSMMLLFLLLLSGMFYRILVQKKSIFVVLMIIVLYTLTEIVTGSLILADNLKVYIFFLINILTSLLIVSFIKYGDFKKIFCDVMQVICMASIVGWIVMRFVPQIASLFPVLINPVGLKGHFAFLTVLVDYSHTGAVRAQGVFWEPGAFQTMIIIAMVMELFNGIDKAKWKRYFIYIVAGALTFSTTGILCIALMCVIYVCNKRKDFLKLFFLLIGLIVIYAYLKENLNTEGFLHYTLFRKLEGIVNYQVGESTHASSRIDSIILPIQAFMNSPILGIGSTGYLNFSNIVGHSMFTCTPINYFAKYGIIFGIICAYGYWRLIYKKSMPLWKTLFIIGVLLLSVSTEEFTLNPLMISLILYGYQEGESKAIKTNISGRYNGHCSFS